MKTRSLTLLLALLMVFTLAACGNNNTPASGNAEGEADEEVPLEEVVLLDNEYVTVTAIAKYKDVYRYEVGYRVFVENHTDYYLSLSHDSVSVDGFMVDDSVYNHIASVSPKKNAYGSLPFYVNKDSAYNAVDKIEGLYNVDGIINVIQNTDGSNQYKSTDWGGEFHID